MTGVYIGLGSNLDDPRQQILRAKKELADLQDTSVMAFSSIYLSKPLDDSEQPDYYNAVARLDTALDSLSLLGALQDIENKHLRKRIERWGPRTLDLDLLLYGEEKIKFPTLTVPHPGISQRDFVLWPLYELAPDLQVPGMGSVRALLEALPETSIQKL